MKKSFIALSLVAASTLFRLNAASAAVFESGSDEFETIPATIEITSATLDLSSEPAALVLTGTPAVTGRFPVALEPRTEDRYAAIAKIPLPTEHTGDCCVGYYEMPTLHVELSTTDVRGIRHALTIAPESLSLSGHVSYAQNACTSNHQYAAIHYTLR